MRKVAWRGSYLARRDANNMRTLATLPSNVFRGARANGTLHRMSRCPRGTPRSHVATSGGLDGIWSRRFVVDPGNSTSHHSAAGTVLASLTSARCRSALLPSYSREGEIYGPVKNALHL